MRSFRLILLAGCGLALAAAVAASEAGHHWSYEGDGNPAHWSRLEPAYAQCGGRSQSPIDIRSASVHHARLPPLYFRYRAAPLRIVDNGHSIQVDYPPGSTLSVGGRQYALLQFHFHHPSEERVDGKAFDMVAHLVHRDAQGHLAVVAVPLSHGAANPTIATLWRNLPRTKGQAVSVPGVVVDAAGLLPEDRDYFTYRGSLTTPPCTEGVRWIELKAPTSVSPAEIERFARLYPRNARPVQPLNGREVLASW